MEKDGERCPVQAATERGQGSLCQSQSLNPKPQTLQETKKDIAAAAKLLQSCPTLCDPIDPAHQAPPSLGFSRQEHLSGFPFPSPMHESEKWKWSRSVVSDSSPLHGLQPIRLLHPWDFPGNSTGVGCHCLLRKYVISNDKSDMIYLLFLCQKVYYFRWMLYKSSITALTQKSATHTWSCDAEQMFHKC